MRTMARRQPRSALLALCCAAALVSQTAALRGPLGRTRRIDFTLLSQKSSSMDLRSESQKSSFNAQDKPTAEQGHMNELNEGQLWQELQPREGTKKEEVAAAAPDIVQKPAVTIYDSTARSAVKAVCWRITAGIVTAVSTLIFTDGNWRIALSMVGSDFASKSVTMFVGERLWNKSQVGRDANGESPMRSVIKAVAWRLFAVLNTLVVGIFFAGSVSVASKIASTDAVVKTTLMVLYERIWNRIRWGRIENTNGDGI